MGYASQLGSLTEIDIRRFSAVIFDMDGVLVDSEPLHFAASMTYLSGRLGIDYNEDIDREFLGSTDEHMFRTLKQRFDLAPSVPEMIAARKAIYLESIADGLPPRPGIAELLETLRHERIPRAVASSALERVIEHILRTTRLDGHFDVVVSGEHIDRPKPDPAIFLKTAHHLDIPPERCCVIEDTINGVTAAKAAGMTAIAFPCGSTINHDLSAADFLVHGSDVAR